MALTQRVELLIDSDDLRRLRAIARRQKTSVAELVRIAVRKFYLETPTERRRLVESILALNLPSMGWEEAKKEIDAASASPW